MTPTGFDLEWAHDIAPVERLRANLEILFEALDDGIVRARMATRTSSMPALEAIAKRIAAAVRALAVDPNTPQTQNLTAALIYEGVRAAANDIPKFAFPDADIEALHRDVDFRGTLGALDTPTTLVRDRVTRTLTAWGVELPRLFDRALPHLVESAMIYASVRPGRPRTKEPARPKAKDARKLLEKAFHLMEIPRGKRERQRGRAGQRMGKSKKLLKKRPSKGGAKPGGRNSPSR